MFCKSLKQCLFYFDVGINYKIIKPQVVSIQFRFKDSFIKFSYNLQCTIDKDNLAATWRASNRFHLHKIALQCAEYVETSVLHCSLLITVENVLISYKLAGVYSCTKFRNECLNFILNKFWDVASLHEFYDLSITVSLFMPFILLKCFMKI